MVHEFPTKDTNERTNGHPKFSLILAPTRDKTKGIIHTHTHTHKVIEQKENALFEKRVHTLYIIPYRTN